MIVALIDDDRVVVKTVAAMLRLLHCDPREFSDAQEALREMPDDVDLVISDVCMPGMDGFAIAAGVAARFGICPPRTLLMSGNGDQKRLAAVPPSQVIGLLNKPLRFADLKRVVDFLRRARNRCPGIEAPFCPQASAQTQHVAVAGWSSICATPLYSKCPFYDSACGQTMRRWLFQCEPLAAASPGRMEA